jgi:hypothetical protein
LGPAKAPQGVPSSCALLLQIDGISHRCQSRNEHKVERCVAAGTIIRPVVDMGDRWVDGVSEGTKDGFMIGVRARASHWAANAPNRATELLRNTARRVPSVGNWESGRFSARAARPLPPWHFRPLRRCSIIFDVGASTWWTSEGHAYCDVLDRTQQNYLPFAPPAWPWIEFCVGTGSGRYRLGNRKKNIT